MTRGRVKYEELYRKVAWTPFLKLNIDNYQYQYIDLENIMYEILSYYNLPPK